MSAFSLATVARVVLLPHSQATRDRAASCGDRMICAPLCLRSATSRVQLCSCVGMCSCTGAVRLGVRQCPRVPAVRALWAARLHCHWSSVGNARLGERGSVTLYLQARSFL